MWFGSREKRGAYFGVPTQALLGEMSCWDDILPKRGKHELESLRACYRGLVRENPSPYPDGSAKGSRKQNKNYFCLGMRHDTANTV